MTAFIAAAKIFLSGGRFRSLWNLISSSAKRKAEQAAYAAAYDLLYPTAETLYWSALELVRQLD
jgi:hypothetical protein